MCLASIKGRYLEMLYLLASFLGLRQGVLLGLLIENVDFEAGTIHIDGSLQYVNGGRSARSR